MAEAQVHASEQARHGRSPLHLALVRRLRETGASGVTCLRGSGASTATTRRMAIACSNSAATSRCYDHRRHPERIADSFEIVDALLQTRRGS